MTKVKFFLGDDPEPFTLKPSDEGESKKKPKKKNRTCLNILAYFYGYF